MRKVLSVFIAVCLVLLLCMGIFVSMPSASADTSGDYQYTVSGGNATITRYTGGGGAVVIPSDLGITSIGDYAFGGCSNLTSITIPDSVTSISDSAFWDCTGLTGVTLPSSISSIAGDAFFGCASLTSINVAAGNKNFCSQDGIVYSLDKETIVAYPNGKSDKTFTIPDSVTSIGDAAFADCTNLTNITIPDSMSNIGKRAFVNCESLTSAVIPTGVTSIIDGMFAYCYSLTSVSIPNGVTTIGSDVFKDCGDLTTVILPNSLKTIGFGAFFWSGITSVNIPEGVVTIEDSAFDECGLKEIVTIPSTVTSIGSRAFYDDEITGFSVASGNLTFSSQDGVLFNKSKSQLIEYPVGKAQTSYIIPSGVTEIRGAAFLDCANLKSVTISGSVKSIDDAAFDGCINLTSVIIPDSVTSIGAAAFSACRALTSVTIPNSVTSIGESAFSGCTGLTTVTIPNNVTTIGTCAFFNCLALTSVTIPNSVTSIGSQAFAHCSKLTSFTVDAGNSSYSSGTDGILFNKTATSLVAYPGGKQGAYVIPNSVTSINPVAFAGCTGLTSVTIPNSVTSIGEGAFSGCTGLATVTIPNNVTTIGTSAFFNCLALTSVTIPNSVTSIGSQAFAYCSKLTSFTVDAGNSSYSSGTDGILFNKTATSLVAYPGGKQGAYVIPNSVTSIDPFAFAGCTGLTSVTIPNSVTSIGGHAFSRCTKLTAAYFLGNAPKMGTYGFESCAPGFTVHYVSGTTGWTNPWYGYPTTTVENATKKQTVLILHIGKSTFTMNGSPKTLDSPPVVKNGRTLVPIRTIIDALGGTVGWEAPSKKATVTLGKKAIALWIGKSAATVNGVSTLIDSTDAKVVPEIINGRTMLPLRFVAENLGTTVGWDQNTQTITITYTP